MRVSFYRPNSPPIIHETIDEETLVVDLDSGSYYHLVSSGAYVWRLLESGLDEAAAGAAIADHYGLDTTEARAEVDDLVADLVKHALIVVTDESPRSVETPPAPTKPYVRAALTIHTDMQELLLLDPVHDVDETGWPTKA
jgi:hypothetical protein